MREPNVPLDHDVVQEPKPRPDASAQLLKAERVQTRARRRKSTPPPSSEAFLPGASELAEAARPLEREVPRGLRRFRLRLEVESPHVPEVLGSDRIASPSRALRLLWPLVFEGEPREVLAVLFLDLESVPIGYHVAFAGTVSRIPVEPRQILVASLLAGAAGFLAAHNHPSGNVEPSVEDILFTRRLEVAAEHVGLRMLDHLILAPDWNAGPGRFRFRSLLRRNAW